MVKILLDLLSLSDGRDKSLKIVQYALNIIIWRLSFTQIKGNEFEKSCQTLQKTLSDSRKVFRLGNWISVWKEVKQGPNWGNSFFLRIILYISKVCALITSSSDDTSWFLKATGSKNPYREKISQWGDIAWTITICCELVNLALEQYKNYIKVQKVRTLQYNQDGVAKISVDPTTSETQLQSIYRERWLIFINQVKLLCDLPVASSHGFSLDTNPGIIAISGFISSSCGLYKVYSKLRK